MLLRMTRQECLKISKIEKKVSTDHTRPCIQTYNKNKKIHVRITSTVKVIRACMFIMLSVLKVTQRVPPTCTIKTDFTYLLARPVAAVAGRRFVDCFLNRR